MISFILLVISALNFTYLNWWVGHHESKCRTCLDEDLPKTAPEPHILSYLLFAAWLIESLSWQFWGITDNPYRHGDAWVRSGDTFALLIIGLVLFCVGSFVYVVFKLGRISGIVDASKE